MLIDYNHYNKQTTATMIIIMTCFFFMKRYFEQTILCNIFINIFIVSKNRVHDKKTVMELHSKIYIL